MFLDVQPQHIVIDMCAAPGSKTAQLLEAIQKEGVGAGAHSGIVIANDADYQRMHHPLWLVVVPIVVVVVVVVGGGGVVDDDACTDDAGAVVVTIGVGVFVHSKTHA